VVVVRRRRGYSTRLYSTMFPRSFLRSARVDPLSVYTHYPTPSVSISLRSNCTLTAPAFVVSIVVVVESVVAVESDAVSSVISVHVRVCASDYLRG
jgi:hypothetical protein